MFINIYKNEISKTIGVETIHERKENEQQNIFF